MTGPGATPGPPHALTPSAQARLDVVSGHWSNLTCEQQRAFGAVAATMAGKNAEPLDHDHANLVVAVLKAFLPTTSAEALNAHLVENALVIKRLEKDQPDVWRELVDAVQKIRADNGWANPKESAA